MSAGECGHSKAIHIANCDHEIVPSTLPPECRPLSHPVSQAPGPQVGPQPTPRTPEAKASRGKRASGLKQAYISIGCTCADEWKRGDRGRWPQSACKRHTDRVFPVPVTDDQH